MATCLTTLTVGRFQASNVNPIHDLIFSKFKCNHFSIVKQNSGAFVTALRVQNDNRRRNMNFAVPSSAKQDPSRGSWKARVFGMIMRIILPFWKGKLGTILRVNEKIETTMDRAEYVANMVEEVAEDVAKVAEGAVNHLPKGTLDAAAESTEKLAEDIDKDAQQAEKGLQKVEELDKEVKSFVQSISQENAERTKEDKGQN